MAKTYLISNPEPPEKKAARTAQARAERRQRQNLRNLAWSIIASLGVVALLVIVVVRPDTNLVDQINWREVAAESADQLPGDPIAPPLSDLWTGNRAEVTTESGSDLTWSIGLLGPENSYVFIDQGFNADQSWVDERVEQAEKTDQLTLGYGSKQITWTEFDRRTIEPSGNNAYILVFESIDSTVVVGGTDARGVLEVATEASWQLAEENLR